MSGMPDRTTCSLLARISHHAAARPRELALAFVSREGVPRELTWAELDAQVRERGARLVREGVAPGDVTFVLSATPAEQVLGFLGAMAAGALPSILSFPSLKQSEQRFHDTLRPIAEATDARWVLTSEDFAGVVDRAGMPRLRGRVLERMARDEAPSAPLPPASEDFLQFSSGTTGLRKCVRIRGRMLEQQALAYAGALSLGPTDRVVSWLPLYHDMGLVACLLVPLFQGIASVHLSPFEWLAEPALLLRAVSDWKGTLVWLPNFAYRLCAEQLRDEDLTGVSLDSLRAFINCSEPVREASHAVFLQRFQSHGVRREHLQACYALAEATFAATQTEPGKPVHVDRVRASTFSREHRALPVPDDAGGSDVFTFVSCGRPLQHLGLRIAGAESERHVGEVELRGDAVIDGYGVDGSAARDAFTPDGWYRTGDLGYLADGQLYLTGRAKDLIIHRGHNVHPADVEECLADLKGLKPGRGVVFGLEDAAAGTENLVVMVETDGDVPEALLRRQVRERIWERMDLAVRDVDVCPAGTLRKSTSGKLSRAANRDLYQERLRTAPRPRHARPPEAVAYEPPVDAWEQQLARLWEDVLETGPIGRRDNVFLDWGADSVTAVRAAAEVQRLWARRLQPVELLGARTVADQAALLRRTGEAATVSPRVLLQPAGEGRPFFLVHAAGGQAFSFVALARQLGPERPVYAFQAPQLDRGGVESMTVEGLATEYLQALREAQPRGPYLLGGWSFGGLVAFEMACRLQAEGEQVARLVLFDTLAPGRVEPPWKHRVLSKLARHALPLVMRWAPLQRLARPLLGPLASKTPLWRLFGCLHLTGRDDVRPFISFAFPQADPRRLRGLGVEQGWDYVMELLGRDSAPEDRALLVPGLDGAGARRALGVARKSDELNGVYRTTRRFQGTLDVIGVRGNIHLQRWRPFVDGQLELHFADVRRIHMSAHRDMMEEDNVRRFVGTVRDLLCDTNRSPPPPGP
ncbi:AMP-binding protein [Corallococcus llansteffanensis]|uniref:Carrier domain-containing protein n=1 Tax=Corallococcus llansteffanensis TaxID=2316731 RepID=A0A3A8PX87_9BACT|nr:AMP-binding protein [Corallococcus llansteffanensis]RKH57012.1 hypothetical protein D7V93_19090 [Corallococcus llansteffanensis]